MFIVFNRENPIYDLKIKWGKGGLKHELLKKPSVFKLVKLLSVNNTKELNNLEKYLSSASKLRAQHCNNTAV